MAAWIDTHLHLGREEFDGDRDDVAARALAAGVAGFLHVGFDPDSIATARKMRDRYGGWVSAGIHPHEAAGYDAEAEALLRRLAREREIVAIGECGLDFFRDLSPRAAQDQAFRRQIALAHELELPMIFHVRDAYPQVRATLTDCGLPARRGVFHAFAGDADFARWAVDQGFLLGIGGPLTYRNSRLPAAISDLPVSSFLLETDAPWLPPQPWRGKRNEPAYVTAVAARLAGLCGLPEGELSVQLAQNFEALFGVQLPRSLWDVQPPASASR